MLGGICLGPRSFRGLAGCTYILCKTIIRQRSTRKLPINGLVVLKFRLPKTRFLPKHIAKNILERFQVYNSSLPTYNFLYTLPEFAFYVQLFFEHS